MLREPYCLPDGLGCALEGPFALIRSIRGTATNQFVQSGKSKFSGLDEALARRRMAQLNAASSPADFGRLNSVGLHKLKGPLREHWSVDVNGPWRIIFRFRDGDAWDVEIADTH